MDCNLIQEKINYVFRYLIVYPIIFGEILLFVSTLLVSLNIGNSRPKGKVMQSIICFICVISLLSLISPLLGYLHIPFPTIIDKILAVVSFLVLLAYPTIIMVFFAWKMEIIPIFRYLIMLAYLIIIMFAFSVALIMSFEQEAYKGKICFGLSCSVCKNNNVDFKSLISK